MSDSVESSLIAGMNRYRRWIDKRDVHVMVAGLLLSELVVFTAISLVYAITFGWHLLTIAAVIVLVPIDLYLGIAQLSGWRWDDSRRDDAS